MISLSFGKLFEKVPTSMLFRAESLQITNNFSAGPVPRYGTVQREGLQPIPTRYDYRWQSQAQLCDFACDCAC
jgi:hypothetical protein